MIHPSNNYWDNGMSEQEEAMLQGMKEGTALQAEVERLREEVRFLRDQLATADGVVKHLMKEEGN